MTHEKEGVKQNYLLISEDEAGQRLDNYLITKLKNVPKSHIYKIIRSGQVRVNKGRVNAFYKILPEDEIRLPPGVLSPTQKTHPPSDQTIERLRSRILYEDENIIILNKPSGMSVHAGSTVRMGIIEAMRYLYPKFKQLELAHRLDSETSGCLILAKRKRILRELHELLRGGAIKKVYLALTQGIWRQQDLSVNLPLHKEFAREGKHMVKVKQQGKSALTVFKEQKAFKQASLMQAFLHTGRTHQIRVHAAAKHHPLAGDDRYGDNEFNKQMQKLGLKRMFLHSHSVEFTLPSTNQHIKVTAPLDSELESVLQRLTSATHKQENG